MSGPNLNVVELYESNFRDPAATLRLIADEIEAGKYGDIGTVAVAVFGGTVEVFGAGPDSDMPSVAILFHAAFMRLSNAVGDHGR